MFSHVAAEEGAGMTIWAIEPDEVIMRYGVMAAFVDVWERLEVEDETREFQ